MNEVTSEELEQQVEEDTPAQEVEVDEEVATDEEVAADNEASDEVAEDEEVDVDEEVAEDDEVAVDQAVVTDEEVATDPEVAADGESSDEDEEEEEDSIYADLFAPGDWFVVHTYSGYEKKVKANLASRIASMNMEDKIFDVVVPTEEVMELKAGKKQLVERKVFPGYILVRMTLDDDSWYVVRNTPGVTGFVGSGARPTPLNSNEVKAILAGPEEDGAATRTTVAFEQGEVVSVVAGPFSGMSGPISELNLDQQSVKVLVDIFGRETPVTLSFDQIEKL